MRISDWSSDVCSSDLAEAASADLVRRRCRCRAQAHCTLCQRLVAVSDQTGSDTGQARLHPLAAGLQRSSRRSRSEEHTSELQSLMRISYAVFCLKKKKQIKTSKHVYLLSKSHI